MHLVPTTEIDVLRGTSTDAYGDETDTSEIVYKKIPASIIERSSIVETGTSGRPRKIRQFGARVSAKVKLQNGDRIRDRNTGDIYIVDSIARVQNPIISVDTRVDLRRVGDTNTTA